MVGGEVRFYLPVAAVLVLFFLWPASFASPREIRICPRHPTAPCIEAIQIFSTGRYVPWVVLLKRDLIRFLFCCCHDCTHGAVPDGRMRLSICLPLNQQLDAMKAFMGGKLKIKGNIMLAQKLQVLTDAVKPKAKL